MKIYADTSVLVAWFDPSDVFGPAVARWCESRSPEFCWNPVLRAELRHYLRKVTGGYAAAAWHSYRASESARRLKLDSVSVSDLLEWGDELSSRFAVSSIAGTWDFVHVAAAQRSRADVFLTCDSAQADLARIAGVRKLHLFEV